MLVMAARPPARPRVSAVRDPNPSVKILARPVAPPEVLGCLLSTSSAFPLSGLNKLVTEDRAPVNKLFDCCGVSFLDVFFLLLSFFFAAFLL